MQLPSVYAPPGVVLLASDEHGRPVGCVGLRDLGDGIAEVRRLFVVSRGRGSGWGRRLMEGLLERARAGGLERLVLTTLPTMTDALALYRSLGFVACAPYVENPTAGVLCFELALANPASDRRCLVRARRGDATGGVHGDEKETRGDGGGARQDVKTDRSSDEPRGEAGEAAAEAHQ